MLSSLSLLQDFLFPGEGKILSPPVLLPFYTGIYFPFNIHASVSLFGVETCPISLYLEWLRAVVKVEQHSEEHGPVRRRVLYYCIGSFSTYPASALSSSFPSGVLWDAKHKIVLGQILRPLFWAFIMRPRQWFSSAQALRLNAKWAKTADFLAPQIIFKSGTLVKFSQNATKK